MPLNSAGITGCCNGKNIYNLGGAHGYLTAKDFDQFAEWLTRIDPSGINIAITNLAQARTREYLEKAGFKTEKVGYLWISTISGNDMRAFNAKAREQLREARLKKAEERNKILAQSKFKRENLPETVYLGFVTYRNVRRLCENIMPSRHCTPEQLTRFRDALENYYRIQFPRGRAFYRSPFGYDYMNHHELRRRIYDLVAAARARV